MHHFSPQICLGICSFVPNKLGTFFAAGHDYADSVADFLPPDDSVAVFIPPSS